MTNRRAFRERRRCNRNGFGGNSRRGSIFAGIAILVAGTVLLLKQMGVVFPAYLFSWQMLLIFIGLVVGDKHAYRGFGWDVPIIVGIVFLIKDFMPDFGYDNFVLPVALLGFGAFIVIRNLLGKKNNDIAESDPTFSLNEPVAEFDIVEVNSVFGGVRKSVVSKTYRQGEVSAVFGSAEINMSQADFEKTAKLELNAVFGSIKLIVPAHWQLKINNNAVLGSVEDHRPQHGIYADKILLVEANAVFGGIEIESY